MHFFLLWRFVEQVFLFIYFELQQLYILRNVSNLLYKLLTFLEMPIEILHKLLVSPSYKYSVLAFLSGRTKSGQGVKS